MTDSLNSILGRMIEAKGVSVALDQSSTSPEVPPCDLPRVLKAAGVPAKFQQVSLESVPDRGKYLDLLAGECRNIAVVGPNGRGKSWLAAALLGHLIPDCVDKNRIVHARWWYFPDLLTRHAQAWKDGDKSMVLEWRELASYQVLVLDDVFMGSLNQTHEVTLTKILETREVALKRTIVTYDLTEEQIPWPRVKSRLAEYQAITLVGKDRRRSNSSSSPKTLG